MSHVSHATMSGGKLFHNNDNGYSRCGNFSTVSSFAVQL